MDPYLYEVLVIHAVEVIAGQDDHILNVLVLGVLQQPQVLANGVRGSLEPPLAVVAGPLRSRQNLHIAIAEVAPVAEVVGARKMAVQGGGIELREDVDFVDPAVDAVAHGDVD